MSKRKLFVSTEEMRELLETRALVAGGATRPALRADATVKLQLVNTGVRVLERSEFKCDTFGWRLAQAERRAHTAVHPA